MCEWDANQLRKEYKFKSINTIFESTAIPMMDPVENLYFLLNIIIFLLNT